MSLINCPDCGHEVSTTATACPNCGHPFAKPIIERKVVVADVPREDNGIPTWVFAVLGIVGVLVLFLLFVFAGRDNDEVANRSLNVDVAARRDADSTRDVARTDSGTTTTTTLPPSSGSDTLTVPSTSAPSAVTVPPSSSTTVTNIPSEPVDKGTVVIDAKIATKSGAPQAVRAEKFYLLDEDLESILSDADLEPINGQSLTNSFGLAVLYPSRYGDFNNKALNAIKKHIKYDTLTDSTGKGEMKNIEPSSYYLFGVTKSGNGFAVWSSPVSITAGKNTLNLSPQRLTEVETQTPSYEEDE
jgi:hypothetical protein